MMYIGPEVAVPVSMFGMIAVLVIGSKWIGYKRSSSAGPEALESLERRHALKSHWMILLAKSPRLVRASSS
jgi:hypothetical protein